MNPSLTGTALQKMAIVGQINILTYRQLHNLHWLLNKHFKTFHAVVYCWCRFMVVGSCWLPFCHVRAFHSLQLGFSLLEFHLAGLRVCPCVLSDGNLLGWAVKWSVPGLCVVQTWGQKVHLCFHFICVQWGHSLSHLSCLSRLHVSLDTFLSHSAQIFCQFAVFV